MEGPASNQRNARVCSQRASGVFSVNSGLVKSNLVTAHARAALSRMCVCVCVQGVSLHGVLVEERMLEVSTNSLFLDV